jgi:hypothetical protein
MDVSTILDKMQDAEFRARVWHAVNAKAIKMADTEGAGTEEEEAGTDEE